MKRDVNRTANTSLALTHKWKDPTPAMGPQITNEEDRWESQQLCIAASGGLLSY